ncbi:MAG: hypothetical protein M3Q94_11445 [Pseudomonadota bacterium]|nr:hypothetical protein [Pseudomonadota bacterium]
MWLDLREAKLARDDGSANPKFFALSIIFQNSNEVNQAAIRVVTETAIHSHPSQFYTGHEQ